jgi:hypothetical protein
MSLFLHPASKNTSNVQRANILVAATGKAEYNCQGQLDWLKPGVVVMDVDISSKEDATKNERGYPIVWWSMWIFKVATRSWWPLRPCPAWKRRTHDDWHALEK